MLVIIGLIIGGVLAGQTLIRSAELQAIVNERANLDAGIQTFRTRYKALPGDMKNATQVWGAADPDPAVCVTVNSGDDRTCNGNGNGRIYDADRGPPIEGYEIPRAFQQLGNAGLIHGSFTGVVGPDGPMDMVLGENIPQSKVAEAGWFTIYVGTLPVQPGAFYMFPGNFGQLFVFGAMVAVPEWGGSHAPYGPIIPVEDVRHLDQKMDDGMPGLGMLRSSAPYAGGTSLDNDCSTTNDPQTSEYNMDSQTGCVIFFKMKL